MSDLEDRAYSGYVSEYNAIVQKMSANEAWAYSFVALYFAFLASLAAATGFLLSSDNDAIQSLNQPKTLLGYQIEMATVLGVLGLSLNAWAIAMVADYKITTRSLVKRLAFLENVLGWSDDGPPGIGASNLPVQHSMIWYVGQTVLVGAVMVLFFMPWLVLLAG